MLKILSKFLSPKALNFLSSMKVFSALKTERIPSLDKVLVFLLYRFSFFRNSFLKSAPPKLQNVDTYSDYFNFRFDNEILSQVEGNGISKVFSLTPQTLESTLSTLDNYPLTRDGKVFKKSITSFKNSSVGEGLNGVYTYKNIVNDPYLVK